MVNKLTITKSPSKFSDGGYVATTATANDTSKIIYHTATTASSSFEPVLSLSMLEQIKAELGFYKNPLRKCGHCGQYGAVFCECPKCGAPIDPKD